MRTRRKCSEKDTVGEVAEALMDDAPDADESANWRNSKLALCGVYVKSADWGLTVPQKHELDVPNLRLIDGAEFMDLVLEHYEQFDARYKGLLPLKPVYVPQLLAEDDEGL